MSGYSTIKRGRMAGDAFTQIRNAVFRDARLSAKAMGVFGHLSTHRAGYAITPERISKHMRDGVASIKGALQELEALGYLYRERERRPDGTFGSMTYYITDQPETVGDGYGSTDAPSADATRHPRSAAAGSRRSQPEVENPPVDCPPQENRTLKKTKEKKTTVLPSVPQARGTDQEGRTRNCSRQPHSRPSRPRRAEAVASTPGVELLLQLGAEDPRYLLTGPALRDQGVAVGALLAAGWTAQQVRQVVLGRPLPERITTSVGAIVARRLGEALAGPAPTASHPPLPRPDAAAEETWTPPPVAAVLKAVPPRVECDGDDGLCGRPVEPGYDRCVVCLARPHTSRSARVGS